MKCIIDRLDDYGNGISYINDKITFIKGGLDSEEVEIKDISEHKKYNTSEVKTINKKSPDRIDIVCKYYNNCGGCQLMHMNFLKENNFKVDKVKNILKKFANINIDNIEIISPIEYNYRNKITLNKKNNKLGLYKDKTNDVVDINYCYLLNSKINDIINNIDISDDIKSVVIKVGNKTDEVMIDIEGNVSDIEKYKNISDSLYINNKCITKEYINSYIGDYIFRIRNTSFFQVNDKVVELLYEEVKKHIISCNSKKVLDLYCGVGTISIFISKYVYNVLGIEKEEKAVIDANENKKLNKIENVSFVCGKTEDKINDLKDYDTIIVDPPRSGLDKNTLLNLKRINADNIIYISCDPVTLARDINKLSNIYQLKEIKLFNMFPRTYHVECVTLLSRKTL